MDKTLDVDRSATPKDPQLYSVRGNQNSLNIYTNFQTSLPKKQVIQNFNPN